MKYKKLIKVSKNAKPINTELDLSFPLLKKKKPKLYKIKLKITKLLII
jgi:hypothetical protein